METLLNRKPTRSAFHLLLIAVAGFIWAGCGNSASTVAPPPVDPNILALLGDTPLTLATFEEEYAKSVGGRTEAADDSMGAYTDFLERYVNFRLKVMDAEALGLKQDSAIAAELSQYREQLARPYMIEEDVINPVIQDIFEKQKEEINASHLLVRIDPKASPEDSLTAYQKMVAMVDSVNAGIPFADVAMRMSEDPTAGRNQGNLGYFTGGRMIQAFEDQAYNTPVGEMTPIFRTRFGYHVMIVHDRRPRTPDIRAAHILIRTSQQDADSMDAYLTADSLKQRIAAGEDFAELATAYSTDKGSARQGGDLGFFSLGRMVKPFEEAAFALENPGDVSDLVRTRFGYHIIKLLERKAPPTYDESYEELKQLAKRLPRSKAQEEAYGTVLREDFGWSMDTLAIQEVVAPLAGDSLTILLVEQKRKVMVDSVASTVDAPLDAAVLGRTLATLGTTTYTVQDFIDHAKTIRPTMQMKSADDVLEALNKKIANDAVDMAADQLEERKPAFKALMDQYLDGILLFRVMEDSVWNASSSDSVGLRAHYDAHAASYMYPERKRVVNFFSSSDSTLKDLKSVLDSGASADLSMYEADSTIVFRMDTTFVADSTNSIYDRVLKLEQGQTTDVVPFRRGFTMLYVDGIEAPRPKTYDEARAEVLGEYQKIVENAWIERLRKRYNVRVFPSRLSAAFAAERMPDAMP